ncbi:ATP-binding protein [Arthrobacter crystallopoietes]|uniref:ATP-binding protein n=1 Tax=Crystallibacter crystallopoietes TaxID=37928 RepID=UPI001ABDBFBB|nr:hypothetical protein [Arthrobacter crystallopoietes]QTG80291.1 hypothetical protein J5251_15690 [Arthrobacter crystallopoietes]
MGKQVEPLGNLQAEITSFIGRRHELSEAKNSFLGHRLVSLVGPGGVGKTRLSLQLAAQRNRNFEDGAWFVELAAALDLREQGAADAATTLYGHLKVRRLLLVLDNCEHIIQPVAKLVSKLLKESPGLRILTTSREPLGLVEERVVPMPPFALPGIDDTDLGRLRLNEAVQLFVERAGAASGRFGLTDDNRNAVVEICRRLDGIPLTIELAAVRTRVMTPEQIRNRLGQRFSLLTAGSPAVLPRHRTLEAAIAWSYDLLDGHERRIPSATGCFCRPVSD